MSTVDSILKNDRSRKADEIARLLSSGQIAAAKALVTEIENEDRLTFETPVDRLRWEIEVIRNDAEQRRMNAAFSGSMGDDGASHQRAIADAMEHTLRTLGHEV